MSELRLFQEKVKNLLLAGKPVILQAPTGSGKTRAAISPFIAAFFEKAADEFPRKCVYAVPMRVLANQFYTEYRALASLYNANYGALTDEELEEDDLKVRIQTGEQARDRQFEGDLIFTTIDQLLSNFLAIPYALSNAQANLNVAAVFGSYLIFDEFHLFPNDTKGGGALGTTLQMLQWLKGITPFVLMTATFSDEMIKQLCELLGAEEIVLSVNELKALPSEQKCRYYYTTDGELTAEAVLAKHKKRSLAICNTVARAQTLYRALKPECDKRGIEIRLLHSRFLKADRKTKEIWAKAQFGKDENTYTAKSAILVATQVIEVGLDISCEHLHTEIAPANSILQRGGRCARYESETGHVHIYPLAPDEKGNINYLPYKKDLCEATMQEFAAKSGQKFDYQAEMAIVNAVHQAEDSQLLELLKHSDGTLREKMQKTMSTLPRKEARGFSSDLIRDVNSITVVIHPEPSQTTVPNPWALEGFSLYRYTVENEKLIQALLERAKAVGLENNGLWVWELKPDDSENSRKPSEYEWKQVSNKAHLTGRAQLFVHPQLATYDGEIGFRFVIEGDQPVPYQPQDVSSIIKPRTLFSYDEQDYQDHIQKLVNKYQAKYLDEVAWVARKLEEVLGLQAGIIDRSIRLTLACHDLGKLGEGWQKWAHDWQLAVKKPVKPEILLAHTFYDPTIPQHIALEKKIHGQRPHHAVEGAIVANKLIKVALPEHPYLVNPVVTAVARHHSADSTQAQKIKLNRYAKQTMQEVFDFLSKNTTWQLDAALLRGDIQSIGLNENNGLVRANEPLEQFLYFLNVRVLKLCDHQGS
jgi:CRISPR-associated endonuclease/helicase Cas3